MRILKIILTFVFSIYAQNDDKKKNDYDIENDSYAESYYKKAEKMQSDAGFIYQQINDTKICPLIVGYANMSWVEKYSSKRSDTLGKKGIDPKSSKKLKDKFAIALANNLYQRIKDRDSSEITCSFHYGGGGEVSQSSGIQLKNIDEIIFYLETLLINTPEKETPDIDRKFVAKLWKESIIRVMPETSKKCEYDLNRYHTITAIMQPNCLMVYKALKKEMTPDELNIDPELAHRVKKTYDDIIKKRFSHFY